MKSSRPIIRLSTIAAFALGFVLGASLATIGARKLAAMNPTGLSPADFRLPHSPSSRPVEIPGREGIPKKGKSIIDVDAEDLEACKNGVVRATISSRGQRGKTSLYLPEHAIHRFVAAGGRGYPLSITIKPDCLSLKLTDVCRESEELFGFSVGFKDTPVRMKALSLRSFSMSPVESDFDGLWAFKFDKSKLKKRLDKGEIAQIYYDSLIRNESLDQAFVNFPPDVNSETTPTMYVHCRYRQRYNERPCTWRVGGPWELITMQSTSREALADWRPFFNRSVQLMRSVSDQGEFYNEC